MMVMVSYGLGIGLAAAAMIARGVAGLLVGAVACGALA
jgi:hypothetical protein